MLVWGVYVIMVSSINSPVAIQGSGPWLHCHQDTLWGALFGFTCWALGLHALWRMSSVCFPCPLLMQEVCLQSFGKMLSPVLS